jgi:RNA recognition motif-containing protein
MFRIYVGNLNFRTDEQELGDLFSQHGQVDNVAIITDRETGRSRGFGFVEMADENEGRAAITALNGYDFGGRPLTVNEARPRTERAGGGGGRGGRRDRY